MKTILATLRKSKPEKTTEVSEWKNIEYFDPVWEQRVVALARLVKCTGKLVDYGCGRQYLRKHLSAQVQYLPVDYKSRSSDTVVADFSVQPYRPIDGEIAFMSGFFEYIPEPLAFIKHIKGLSYREIVMSYCPVETVSSMQERVKLGWKNHFSLERLLAEFLGDFTLTNIGSVNKNTLFRFERIP